MLANVEARRVPRGSGEPVLVLGGTREGRLLADELLAAGFDPISSLVGATAAPRRPVGRVRTGGFGGIDGLTRWLRENRVRLVVDATHPYAAQMSEHAARAGRAAGVPVLRLDRPGWADHPGAVTWHWVDGHDQAASTAARLGSRPLLTIGRTGLEAYRRHLATYPVVVRVAEPWARATEPDAPSDSPGWPSTWRVLVARGPFDLESERRLLDEAAIDVLVSKDAGGQATAAKLEAARRRGIPVVMLRRPPAPAGVPTVPGVAQALSWCLSRRGRDRRRRRSR